MASRPAAHASSTGRQGLGRRVVSSCLAAAGTRPEDTSSTSRLQTEATRSAHIAVLPVAAAKHSALWPVWVASSESAPKLSRSRTI